MDIPIKLRAQVLYEARIRTPRLLVKHLDIPLRTAERYISAFKRGEFSHENHMLQDESLNNVRQSLIRLLKRQEIETSCMAYVKLLAWLGLVIRQFAKY